MYLEMEQSGWKKSVIIRSKYAKASTKNRVSHSETNSAYIYHGMSTQTHIAHIQIERYTNRQTHIAHIKSGWH